MLLLGTRRIAIDRFMLTVHGYASTLVMLIVKKCSLSSDDLIFSGEVLHLHPSFFMICWHDVFCLELQLPPIFVGEPRAKWPFYPKTHATITILRF